MSEAVIYTLCATNLLLAVGLIASQFMSRKDMRSAANGVAEFYAKLHEQTFKHYEFDKNTLRGELEKAHSRLINVRMQRSPSPSSRPPSPSEPPSPRAPSPEPHRNGRAARERDFATPTGVG